MSIKSWEKIKVSKSENPVNMNGLLFKIVNKKENIVVFGDKEFAVEIGFFDGGYNYKLFASSEAINDAINQSIDSMTDF